MAALVAGVRGFGEGEVWSTSNVFCGGREFKHHFAGFHSQAATFSCMAQRGQYFQARVPFLTCSSLDASLRTPLIVTCLTNGFPDLQ